jgi:prophage regulatory protein
MAHAILRLKGVKTRTGLSRSTIYLRVAEGVFPRPIRLGGRAVGWLEAEIDGWLSALVEQSRESIQDQIHAASERRSARRVKPSSVAKLAP